ncbi:MAG: hypothetical protein NVS3B2_09200 [Ramlibacter sp.]
MKQSLPSGLFALGVAVLLSGCATGYLLDNSVQSFSGLSALPASATYRFDRLPSQQASPVQSQLEAFADPALLRAGLRRDDAAPHYSVQVSARVQPVVSPWADPWDAWGGHRFLRYGFGWPYRRLEPPWFEREVTVVMRELSSNRVVYETHAASDSPLSDNAAVFPAMFQAAMQGFPAAPPGPRRVDIQVGSNL